MSLGLDLGGIAGVAGGLWTNERNKEFAEEMAGSQYQRAVNDMKAAGLNPNAVFGSGGGSPAAAPGGQETNPAAGMGGGLMSSAKGVMDLRQQMAQTSQTEAMTDVTKAKASEAKASAKIEQNAAEVSDRETSAKKTVMDTTGGKILHGINEYGIKPLGAMLGIGNLFGMGKGAGYGGRHSAKDTSDSEKARKHEAALMHEYGVKGKVPF